VRTENEIPASAVILLPKFIDVCRSIAEISSQRHKSGMKSFWVEKPLRPRPIRSNVQKGADKYTRLTPLLTVDRCLKKVCECARFGGLAAGFRAENSHSPDIGVAFIITEIVTRGVRGQGAHDAADDLRFYRLAQPDDCW
jgi:hypothetical protein